MKWFRMYGDMPDDPKIGTLSDSEFRTWVELLCLACKEQNNGVTGATKQNLNWLLRRDVTVTVDVLLRDELIHENKVGIITISNWEKRQMRSDDSAVRMRKSREKSKRDVTNAKSDGPEENRIEKNREEKKVSSRGSRFALTQPPEEWISYCKEKRPDLDPENTFETFKNYWMSVTGAKATKLDWFMTWKNWCLSQKQNLIHKTIETDEQRFTRIAKEMEDESARH